MKNMPTSNSCYPGKLGILEHTASNKKLTFQ